MPEPDVTVLDDYATLSLAAADLVASVIATRPTARVVIATGATPMGLYEELARRTRAGSLDARGITVFPLDEYVGITPEDRRSLLAWALRSFVEPLGIPRANVVPVPQGGAEACAAYDREVALGGGYDLAILGIGPNGHIGFNEPPSAATSPTRIVDLSPESVRSNATYWGGEEHVPPRAVTIGLAGLLRTRTIVLLAAGPAKHAVVRRAVLGPVTDTLPASHLRSAPQLHVLVDRAAWDGGEPAT